jgi:hypothetical protein
MVNGYHDELDSDFLVDGLVFSKLFYLVEKLSATHMFLSSDPDPHTKLASCFAADHESYRRMSKEVLDF